MHTPEGVWRREGHYLRPEDLGGVVAAKPDVVVIGTGANGVMQVPEKTVRWLEEKGIAVKVARTAEAVKLYNRLCRDTRVVAALHLTC
ncbi:MAG: MTH938/NDUFAF3 family protein [Nitrospirota bacterium]